MRRLIIAVCVLLAAVVVAIAVVWFVPSVQDALIRRAMVNQIAKADNAAVFKDDALHILLCGTGSPIPDPKRADACTAIIAGGHVVIIDTGPGAWAKLAQANVPPPAQIDTVLLTHLHSDHIGDLGEVAQQSWIGGRKTPIDIYGPPAPDAYKLPQDAEGDTFGTSGTADVVKGFAEVSKHADVLVHEALNPQLVEMLAASLDLAGHARQAKITRDTIDYHTSPVEAAGIADEANVKLLVLSHIVPALPNALMRHMFLRDVKAARGSGDTMLGRDLLMISLPAQSKEIKTTCLN
jgi:ribonuclease BN (tRNA processing enzyme)